MRAVIVGHRGVGKSSLLKRWKVYQPELTFYDLDDEIERAELMTISKIFSEKGEDYFRKAEVQALQSLLKENTVVALGAGFQIERIPHGAHILWLRRDTDSHGRIFLDRPRLNPELSALEEFQIRFQEREVKFAKVANQIYTMPEGLELLDEQEKQILTQTCELNALLTIKTNTRYKNCQYEIRDDLTTDVDLQSYKPYELLYSVRTNRSVPQNILEYQIQIDWDLKRPILKNQKISILSTHADNLESALAALKPFENSTYQLKLCPLVLTWEELKKGFEWQQGNPSLRSFLPRSEDGRWSWFRLFMKGRQKINFVREGEGSATDQPTVWEWISEPKMKTGFAAVLGSPIVHSYSPVYHKIFFRNKGMPFYRIKLDKSEWSEAFNFLDQIGLKAAAVTSPLKELAGEIVKSSPINTLKKSVTGWEAANTDELGAKALLEPYLHKSTMVWGGGGVLKTLKNIIPNASYYSVQSGNPRADSVKARNPEVLVWAAPTGSLKNFPTDIYPQVILDLNYTQNSEGLILAQKLKCHYVSGAAMFKTQAQAQQDYWFNLN